MGCDGAHVSAYQLLSPAKTLNVATRGVREQYVFFFVFSLNKHCPSETIQTICSYSICAEIAVQLDISEASVDQYPRDVIVKRR